MRFVKEAIINKVVNPATNKKKKERKTIKGRGKIKIKNGKFKFNHR